MFRNTRSLLKGLGYLAIRNGIPAFALILRCKVTVTAYPTPIAAPPIVQDKRAKVSKAMKAYMERSQEHDSFMKAQTIEYEIGKRHLANMMGEDAESFSQDDVDRAIEYLFPSGIYDKKARPFLKPPEEVFPQQKAAQFDETGRPNHSMFYTGKPNFFKTLFDIVEKTIELNAYEDAMIKQNIHPDPALKLDLASSVWLTKDQLEIRILETINDVNYINFQASLERLLNAPFSYLVKDYIMQYRKELQIQGGKYTVVKPQQDEDGRYYVTIYECLRKKSRGDVTIRTPGTGLITVNGQDITYFDSVQSREQLLFPLIFTNLIGKIDIEANVEGGGWSSQAGALRWGIAMGLRSFVDEGTIEQMRLAGLLQRDYRTRERKKPGQEGARRKFTWKKR